MQNAVKLVFKKPYAEMAVFTIIFSFIVLILTFIYFVTKVKFNYWKKKGVPHLEPSFPFGNYGKWIMQREYQGETVQKICKKFPKEPCVGAYIASTPVFIVQDPEMIKLVMTKEFSHFSSRELMDYVHKETFGRSLISDYGDDWKFTRTNMAPMFTSAKLKNMFPLIEDCAVDFERYLDKEIKGKPVEAREFITSYAMASFVSCAFGIDLKNFGEKNVFTKMGAMFFEINTLRGILLVVRQIWPSLFYGIGLRQLPLDLTLFFRKLLSDVFESRGYKPSPRKDFVDSFLALKETAEKQFDHIDDEYIIAQTIAIFAGGFETSATTLSFMLYEIAKNDEIQAKVHEEIDEYLKQSNGKITFDCLTELPFMNACMEETMRFYPIVGALTREVTKNYTLPSGTVLEKGLRIHLPVYHLHHNPEYFPNPENFRPERFYGESKQDIVPYSYLAFGEGPRNCIGKRFAKLQSLPAVVTILRNHRVVLADDMPTKIVFEPKSLTTVSKGGIRLRFLPRS